MVRERDLRCAVLTDKGRASRLECNEEDACHASCASTRSHICKLDPRLSVHTQVLTMDRSSNGL